MLIFVISQINKAKIYNEFQILYCIRRCSKSPWQYATMVFCLLPKLRSTTGGRCALRDFWLVRLLPHPWIFCCPVWMARWSWPCCTLYIFSLNLIIGILVVLWCKFNVFSDRLQLRGATLILNRHCFAYTSKVHN